MLGCLERTRRLDVWHIAADPWQIHCDMVSVSISSRRRRGNAGNAGVAMGRPRDTCGDGTRSDVGPLGTLWHHAGDRREKHGGLM